ncbi:UGSC family (seleno)protein [Microtetraspora fusca]|uniref:UGSC family (seleno)protein n=1 Tax=Microtetraspora fusca TaxID=1997 RepID=UPI000835F6E2|nr:UGSC family (seleno)protein [Microtetraspora fusca]
MFDRILDPTGLSVRPAGVASGARRLPSLAGARVGLLDNTKQNAALLLAEIGELMTSRYGAVVTIRRTKEMFALPVDEPLLSEMKTACDVVVVGVGDCGSCSASAVADGITFEREGVPAAVICSDAFAVTARAMAEVHGDADFDFLMTPHPVAVLNPEQVAVRAGELLDVVVARVSEEGR